jgi:hypothetical protein
VSNHEYKRTIVEEKVYRVGLLPGVNTFNTVIDGFKAKMTELGYTEGENITDPAGSGLIKSNFVARGNTTCETVFVDT